MKALSAKLANVIENAARGAIPEARFGREFVPSPTEAGTANALAGHPLLKTIRYR